MKRIKQISVFLENSPGRMAQVTSKLADNDVNIRALSVADTSDFGILRMIVNNPDKAYEKLKEAGFAVSITEVLAVRMPDIPGALYQFLEVLRSEEVNLEYMYAFCGVASGSAINVIRIDQMDKACKILAEKNIDILDGDVVYAL